VKRILFVDDEPSILSAACNSLRSRRREWEAVLALDAEDALSLMQQGHFDAMVCDLHMPGDSGETLLRRVAADYPHVKRLVLTGDLSPATAARVGPLCHRYLEKPCNAEILQQALAEAIT
jgi:CheY-like chemotaxis protein